MNDQPDKPNNPEEAAALDALAVDKSLETVRDILFGAQVREANQRDKELENLIQASVDQLEKRIDKQVADINRNIEKLQLQLAKEAEKTARQIAKRFEDTAEAIASLESETQRSQNEMFEQINADRDDLEKQARQWNEDLAKQLDNVSNRLTENKLDRSTLAALLGGMAAAIADDPEPGKKS